jgi:broad specificity phosphatase PhoE
MFYHPSSHQSDNRSAPCDTGSPTSLLAKDPEYAGLDFSSIPDDWTSKKGIYDPRNVAERAKQVRQWLRAREENEIVVVAHGDILRTICAGTTDSYLVSCSRDVTRLIS